MARPCLLHPTAHPSYRSGATLISSGSQWKPLPLFAVTEANVTLPTLPALLTLCWRPMKRWLQQQLQANAPQALAMGASPNQGHPWSTSFKCADNADSWRKGDGGQQLGMAPL
ncbi:hypothetical protein CHLRE_16g661976v5 [Chlamydomonas reinhardtii]|uniref:Uncharacterized protein n=1 Tax=Chlamydomonas reinhardtii TaxID=3055 RepID=A0A2K3CTK8_CHLRE|nr:uncharacterized protein CHLRE_16g661976v5 [Chlamydomonas reinhardtii]PNW71624.1 hypothetical protein CHLRE_16g661976v5 [Chlamydomonas reinhardtii]